MGREREILNPAEKRKEERGRKEGRKDGGRKKKRETREALEKEGMLRITETKTPTMATPSRAALTPPSSFSISACSSAVKQVCLYDWWLVKPDSSSNSRQLSVGGISSEERLGIRVFHSAPILKRYNDVTLETADGIIVTICGTINRSRMLRNGFTQEVCKHFLIGFPYYWEEFVNKLFSEESTEGALPHVLSNLTGVVVPLDRLSIFSSGSLDDLPGALLRDFSLFTPGDSANCQLMKSMFGDILEKYEKRENDVNKTDHKVTSNSIDEDNPIKGKKSAAQQNHQGADDLSVTETRRQKLQKTELEKIIGFESNALRNGPLTRRMASKNLSKKDENVDKPNKECKSLVTGKIVSGTTRVTRTLNLRNRSLNLIVQSTD